jgi:hypothetical protein
LNGNTSVSEMYLHNYGYRSGLNNTMITHLNNLTLDVLTYINLNKYPNLHKFRKIIYHNQMK